MASYEKTNVVSFADTDLEVNFAKDNGGVVLEVVVPGESGQRTPWADVYTPAERATLGPLLKKAVKFELERLGYTEV